jgi:O-antigen ligase
MPVGAVVDSHGNLPQPATTPDPLFESAIRNTTRKLAYLCTLGFLFFRFSFLHEYILGKYWVDTHAILIFGALSTGTCLVSGLFLTGVRYKTVRIWLMFFGCMCLSAVFSSWRGGSFEMVVPYIRTTLPLLLLIPGVAFTTKEINKLVCTIGIAGATTILVGTLSEDFRAGRLQLETTNGSIQNANDYAAHLILVMPAIAYATMQHGRSAISKAAGLGVIALGVYELLGTGSRGGFVAVIAAVLYMFLKGSSRLRLGIIVGVPVCCAVILPLAPSQTVQRMLSVFVSSDESEEAAESRMGRKELLIASLEMTISHPLLGVGPAQFQNFQGGQAAAQGERGMWHETHNAYTQISSECGVPAIGFYIAGIVLTFRSFKRAAASNNPVIAPMARTLAVMLVGYSVCLLFLSQGYGFVFLVMCGISVSMERALQYEDPATAGLLTA